MTGLSIYRNQTLDGTRCDYWDVGHSDSVSYTMTTTGSTDSWIEPLRNISELERYDRKVKSQLMTRELGRSKVKLPINTKGFYKPQYFNKSIQ